MTDHKQFADDLALYALGALEPAERAALEEHLRDCAACRRELEQLRGDTALLALSVADQEPPARARRRLMSAIAAEPRDASRRRSAKFRLWGLVVPSFVAAALALVAFIQARQNDDQRRELLRLESEYAQNQAELLKAVDVVETLNDPAAVRFTLSAAHTPPQPQGKAIYQSSRRSLIFLASNLPALPPQKAYELWLIPAAGAPIPAGVFKPDANGAATVLNPPLPEGVQAKTFAVTVEPEGGSAAPTSQPIMTGVGG